MGLWIVPVGEMEGFCRSCRRSRAPDGSNELLTVHDDLANDLELLGIREFVSEIWLSKRRGHPMTTNSKRLIEVAFPLKQVSLDSVHEKNVRHGHISTLHIWPARRPLAASRAALIATLLPDPGVDEKRKAILDRMAGRVTEKTERKRVNGRISRENQRGD